ncbi:MAG: hypothetical protein V7776_09145 [Halopseudomonas aestusnigri]
MLQKISSLSLMLFILFILATSVFANEEFNQNPIFQGEIELINEPIIVRYSSLPKSRTINTSSAFGKLNGRVLDHKSISKGAIEILEEGKSLKMLISSFTTELINEAKKETVTDGKKMSFNISPFGKVHNFSLYSPDLTLEELQLTKEAMSDMAEEVVVQLPSSGIESGYKFKTNFNNRQSIVVDYRGPLSSLIINHEKVKGNLDGYYIMDIATGISVYSEIYLQAKFSHKSKINLYRIEKTEIQ